MLRLAIIYVEYDKARYAGAWDKLRLYLDRIPFCHRTYFLVDNRHEGSSLEQISDDTILVAGDNSDREFSGWQRGVDVIKGRSNRFDLVLFANEAFLAPGRSFLEDYSTFGTLLRSTLLNAAIGRVDSYGEQGITLYGYDVGSWICTNCFFVPGRVVLKLPDMVSVDEIEINRFISETYECSEAAQQLMPVGTNYFKPDAPISRRLQELVVEWLTCRWHSRFKLEDNWDLFRIKTRAIFNEALLTVKLREAGCRIKNYGAKTYY